MLKIYNKQALTRNERFIRAVGYLSLIHILSVESTEEHSGGKLEFGVGMDFRRGVLFDRRRGGLYAALVESSDENRRGFGCGPGGLSLIHIYLAQLAEQLICNQ